MKLFLNRLAQLMPADVSLTVLLAFLIADLFAHLLLDMMWTQAYRMIALYDPSAFVLTGEVSYIDPEIVRLRFDKISISDIRLAQNSRMPFG